MINLLSNIPAGFLPAMVELPEDSNPEYVRDDVVEAVGGTFAHLYSSIPTVRLCAESGKLDARCTSGPVVL